MRTDDRRQRTEAEKVRGWEGARTKRLEDQKARRSEDKKMGMQRASGQGHRVKDIALLSLE